MLHKNTKFTIILSEMFNIEDGTNECYSFI